MKEIVLNKIDQVLYYDKLSNGLEVYMLENNNVSDFYITLNVKYGSCDTCFKIDNKKYNVSNGIAHFLEHVNFNVDDKTTAHDLFKSIGSNINAFTTFDITSYEVSSNNNIEKNINLLLGYVLTSYFTDSLIEKEKGIIIEEIRMGKNNPQKNLFYETNKAIYHNSNRRNLITGDIEDVQGITKEELELVHSTFYVPSNMFIIITGNFKHNEVLRIIKKFFEDKKYNDKKIKKIYKKEKDSVLIPFREIINKQVEIPKVKIGYKINKDVYKGYEMEEIIAYLYTVFHYNIGTASIFKEKLLEENKISYIGTSIDIEDDYLIISIICETNYPEEVIDRIIDKVNNMSVDEEDLVIDRRVRISNLIYLYDDIEYVNTDIMDQLISYKKIYDNLYDIYNNSNLDTCREIIKKLDLSNKSIIIMKNK